MNKRMTLIPGVRYNFAAIISDCVVDPYIDFLNKNMEDIIFHVKYRLEEKALVCNYLVAQHWMGEEEIRFDHENNLNLSLTFDIESVFLTVNAHMTKCPLPRASFQNAKYVRSHGFRETSTLLDLRSDDGRSGIEVSSIEYTILEARLSKLELIFDSFQAEKS